MELLPCPFCGSNKIVIFRNLLLCDRCESIARKDYWNTRHSPWISVSDKLPDEDGYYVVLLIKGSMAFAMYLNESKQFTIIGDITHYMPIPTFPSGFLPKEKD